MPSAANMAPPGTPASGNEGAGTPRPNPVALEVLVNATGSKASGGSGSRDLFSEETSTVLVFKDGAVIRLEAPVSVGQLLFLTHKKTNKEVVCQVLKKRAITPESNYVELQFTEECPGFWGASFTEEKKAAAPFQEEKHAEAAAVTAQEPETPVAPHTTEDVDQLKREVEALREQLAWLDKKNAAKAGETAKAEPGKDAAAREEAMREAAKNPERMAMQAIAPSAKEELAAVNEPSPMSFEPLEIAPAPIAPVSVAPPPVVSGPNASAPATPAEPAQVEPELLMPGAKSQDEPARPMVGMSLPVWRMEKTPEEQLLEEENAVKAREDGKAQAEAARKAALETHAAEDLLPKPALDFSKAPKNGTAGQVNAPAPVYAPKVSKLRLVTLSVVLVLLVVGGAWFGKWWQYLPLPLGKKTVMTTAAPAPVKKASVAANAAVPAALPRAGNEGAPGAGGSPAANPSAVNAAAGNTTAPATAPAGNRAEKKSDGGAANAENTATPPPASAEETSAAPLVKKSSGREKAAEKKAKVPAAEPVNSTETVAGGDGPLVAAKLLRAATPVYPPEAMRNYITGDVKAEVVVKASGRVGEVRVISGPQALRDAAVEALKRYEYTPATQSGKAVESKTMEVVKFWFNP